MMWNGYYADGYGMGYGFGPFGFIFGLFWILLLIFLFVSVLRFLRHGGNRRHFWDRSALDILNDRYAKGEINKQEYEEKKKDILEGQK